MNPILAWAFLLAAPDAVGPPTPATVANQLLTQRFSGVAPGAAVLIVHRGQPLIRQGFGYADVAKLKPITPTTNFDLASCSKQFTAAAIMLLADRGKLAFDDPVTKHIPELAGLIGDKPATIEHLLHHTSGLPEYLQNVKIFTPEFCKMNNLDVAKYLCDLKMRFVPGTKFEYCNSNYVMLALIAERAAGLTLPKFMNDELFQPLGMTGSVVMNSIPFDVPNRAVGYRKPLFTRHETSSADASINGDGNVFSSIADLELWDKALNDGKLFKPETWKRALTSGKIEGGKDTGYGYGWAVKVGKQNHGHSGAWAGTRTFIGRWPEQEFFMVVLSNDESVSPDGLAAELIRMFLPKSN